MTRNTPDDKKKLRAEVRSHSAASLAVIPTEPARATRDLPYSTLIEQIESLPEWAAARTVALYHALPDEVSTGEMLRRWQGLKRLALPVITGNGVMVFREYTGEEALNAGAFGIAAPTAGSEIPPSEIDLALVPGVAFDPSGHRLGRGGGFYDRYLSHPAATHIYKAGLCHPHALIPKVPTEPHDVVMDIVITN